MNGKSESTVPGERAGMTPIVKNTTRLVSGFITVFAVYVGLTGHLSPGGGFAGGVILAAGVVLIILAFGREDSGRLITARACHLADSAGVMCFLAVAVLGYAAGGFFVDFLPAGKLHRLPSGGTIPISNLAILLKVAAGLAGAFLALSGFRLVKAITGPGSSVPSGERKI